MQSLQQAITETSELADRLVRLDKEAERDGISEKLYNQTQADLLLSIERLKRMAGRL